MKLEDLAGFNPITIQCHDNPDADALASGFGLLKFFEKQGKKVRLIYAGRNHIQKTNLQLMIDKLKIPIEYVEGKGLYMEGLLITVDCQYGGGNVTRFSSDRQAVIDHHQVEISGLDLVEIHPEMGSCSTLVWWMMKEAGYSFEEEEELGTAFYYGLLSDTSQFSEMYSPLDMDMKDSVPYRKSLINLFRNSNLSLEELELAGLALIKSVYNESYHFATIKSPPCDPNILGLISDFLIQVDAVWTCLVFNEQPDGLKYSVRSCVKEVSARELAGFLADGMGSGGGHVDKAGGFIKKSRYNETHGDLNSEVFFGNQMIEYFRDLETIYSDEYVIRPSELKEYEGKQIVRAYVKLSDLYSPGTPVVIRTLEGDCELTVTNDTFVIIKSSGETITMCEKRFNEDFEKLNRRVTSEDHILAEQYVPTIRNLINQSAKSLLEEAWACFMTGSMRVWAKQLSGRVKVFKNREAESYMLGMPGDYLVISQEKEQEITIIEQDIFSKTYCER